MKGEDLLTAFVGRRADTVQSTCTVRSILYSALGY